MDRWNRLSSLLDEMLDAAPEERSRRLEELGKEDPKLRVVLEELLDAHCRQTAEASTNESFRPDAPLHSDAPPEPEAEPDADPRLGTVIGGYRLTEHLGEGGMATVYRGEKQDATFDHSVAVKLVRADRTSPAMLRRFRDEQRILASLNHPGIARLFDGGLTEDGQPYIVMELIEGLPLDRYCDGSNLGVEARLGLFCDVCEAIEYAHANLIVHRDLKPSNILVTADGTVKILDFGVAKLLESAELAPPSDDLTSLFGIPMTPAYAAPEQLEGGAVTTATDVYSLGLVLYELLTGRKAFLRSSGRSSASPLRDQQKNPRRPSRCFTHTEGPRTESTTRETSTAVIARRRSTTVPRLLRRLQGDLDVIVLKALRREPTRRYRSALALREDLERHREQLPIRARPESWRYSLDRFVRRHRKAVAASLLATVCLVAALAVALAGWAAARREAATSERISRFLVETFRAPDPTTFREGGQISASELLRRAADRVRAGNDASPEVRARLNGAIGESFLGIGDFERAAEVVEASVRLWTQAHGGTSPQALGAKNLLARIWTEMGRLDEAEALYDILMVELGKHPTARALKATVANDFGILLKERGELDRAETLFRQALKIHRELGTFDAQEGLRVRNNLAICRRGQGDLEEAETLLREVLHSQRLSLREPHADIAAAVNNLARVVRARGDLDEAEALYRQALNQRLAVFGKHHPETAQSYNNIGALRYFRKDFDGASEYFETAFRIWRNFFGGDHPRLCAALSNLGSLRRKQGRFAEAEEFFRQAAEMEARLHGADHPRVSKALYRWADLRLETDNAATAVPLLERSLEILEASLGLAEKASIDTVLLLTNAYRKDRRPREAQALLARAQQAAADRPEILERLSSAADAGAISKPGEERYPNR